MFGWHRLLISYLWDFPTAVLFVGHFLFDDYRITEFAFYRHYAELNFLNVCIYRLPLGKSVISPPSACGSCGHRLGALDMIPVLSYFLLRGRCRYCNAAYSARYMLVELLTGILFALCGLYYLPGLKIILVFFFVACLIVQAFIDLDHQILLDEILMLMLPTGIIYAYYALPDMWDSLYGLYLPVG